MYRVGCFGGRDQDNALVNEVRVCSEEHVEATVKAMLELVVDFTGLELEVKAVGALYVPALVKAF